MPKDEGSGAGSKPGRKPHEIHSSTSRSSSLTQSDERIDPMINPQTTDPLDYPMALFDPVTVNTHEKERKERQTVNTLNDIYKVCRTSAIILVQCANDAKLVYWIRLHYTALGSRLRYLKSCYAVTLSHIRTAVLRGPLVVRDHLSGGQQRRPNKFRF